MLDFKRIPLSLLDANTGQIPGLPANPRQWTDAEVRRLAKSMKDTPELAEARGCVVWDKRVDMNSNNFADGEMAWCSFHTPLRIYHQLWNGMIREGEHENRVHPTQKPVRMLSEVLRDFSGETDNILDCFGGSGSTLMACEQTGRHCYMMEYDEHYCDVIIARWEKFTGRKATKIE